MNTEPILLQALDADSIGDGALFLIVGGLFMLGLVVALVVLRSIFPTGKPSQGLAPDKLERRVLPTPDLALADTAPQGPTAFEPTRLQEGHREAARVKSPSLDDALTHTLRNRWGNPRLLRYMDDRTVVRLHDCAECGDEKQTDAGCSFFAGFLEGVMRRLEGAQAQVSEVRCRRNGQPACEFEVRH